MTICFRCVRFVLWFHICLFRFSFQKDRPYPSVLYLFVYNENLQCCSSKLFVAITMDLFFHPSAPLGEYMSVVSKFDQKHTSERRECRLSRALNPRNGMLDCKSWEYLKMRYCMAQVPINQCIAYIWVYKWKESYVIWIATRSIGVQSA